MQQYLKDVEEILERKLEVLSEIIIIDEEELKTLSDSSMPIDQLDSYLEEMAAKTEELNELGESFDKAFSLIDKNQIDNMSQVAIHIKELNSIINDKIVKVQALEKELMEKMQEYLRLKRIEVGEGRNSSKAAMNYYKVQNNATFVDPQFMDDKK